MAKKPSAPNKSKPATIHDQKATRGNGGELHQIAEGDTPVMTGCRRSEQPARRRARPDIDRGFPFPRKAFPLRP